MTAYPVTLDTAELATIRAALWLYHEEGMGEPDNRCDHVQALATNEKADECVSLDAPAVWELFQRLNTDTVQALSGHARLDRLDILARAESFIAGFEDDETQEGIDDLLADLRAAIGADSSPQSASPGPEGQSAPDEIEAEAERIGGGTANLYLASLIGAALSRATEGQPLNALDLAALSEAESRLNDAHAEGRDDPGDYFGPSGPPADVAD